MLAADQAEKHVVRHTEFTPAAGWIKIKKKKEERSYIGTEWSSEGMLGSSGHRCALPLLFLSLSYTRSDPKPQVPSAKPVEPCLSPRCPTATSRAVVSDASLPRWQVTQRLSILLHAFFASYTVRSQVLLKLPSWEQPNHPSRQGCFGLKHNLGSHNTSHNPHICLYIHIRCWDEA